MKQYLEDIAQDEERKKALINGKRVDLAEQLRKLHAYNLDFCNPSPRAFNFCEKANLFSRRTFPFIIRLFML